MHLTNYAINKEHENYVENDKTNEDSASKRSMEQVLEQMEYDEDIGEEKVKKLKFDIYDIIIKSLSMATG